MRYSKNLSRMRLSLYVCWFLYLNINTVNSSLIFFSPLLRPPTHRYPLNRSFTLFLGQTKQHHNIKTIIPKSTTSPLVALLTTTLFRPRPRSPKSRFHTQSTSIHLAVVADYSDDYPSGYDGDQTFEYDHSSIDTYIGGGVDFIRSS